MRAALATLLGAGSLLLSPVARAEEPEADVPATALGLHLDLFPTVVSAANGELGYAPQVWFGVERVRIRLIGAHLEPPDSLAFSEGFVNPTTTVFAVVFDYTFGEHFDGFWISAGFESWQRTIEHERAAGRAAWSSTVATLGAGYTWLFSEHFYLDPWAGVHATLNPESVDVGGHEYEPLPVVANASLKVGAMLEL